MDKEANTRVGDLKMRSAPQLRADTRLYDMLRLFETGRCHMAVLVQPPGQSTPRTSVGQSALPVLALFLSPFGPKALGPTWVESSLGTVQLFHRPMPHGSAGAAARAIHPPHQCG